MGIAQGREGIFYVLHGRGGVVARRPDHRDRTGDCIAYVARGGARAREPFGQGRVAPHIRQLGAAAGSQTTGLNHIEVQPGKWSTPLHCHSVEE